MGSEDRSAYTTDIVYPSAFGAFQAPVHVAYAGALGGRRPPSLERPFRYCDLGSGAGLTLCVLADCYPEAEFHGVDINPEHVRQARELARSAGLGNVTFHEASFADLDKLKLPQFEFVAMSGVYSWLPRGLRDDCLRWIGRNLSPDGLLFLHYGALPGNSQIDALYTLVREAAAQAPGDSLQKFASATALMSRLSEANARFFVANPYARAWLKGLPEQDPRSMAHEVLNAQPTSLSVRDVADETSPHGLVFVANAQVELNHLPLVAPPALLGELEGYVPIAREMLMDAVRNTHSRMDVMASEGVAPEPFRAVAADLLLDRLSTGPLTDARRKLTESTGHDFNSSLHGAILSVVNGAPLKVSDVVAHPALKAFDPAAVDGAVQLLVATKLLNVLRRGYAPTRAPGAGVRLASRLNQVLLEERIEAAGQLPLASPVAGTQVLLPPADRLALLSILGGDFAAAWRRVQAAGQRVRYEGRAVGDARELQVVAARRAEAIGAAAVASLSQLGILT